MPAHKFYLIGIGKDVEVATNSSASGRAKNRRVEIQLLSNAQNANGQDTNAQGNSEGAMNSAPAATGQSNPPAANNQASAGSVQQ